VVYDHGDASQSQPEINRLIPCESSTQSNEARQAAMIDEPFILAVETATRAGGVALARGERILSSRSGDASVSHSTNLIAMVEQVLADAGVRLSDVDLFAVAVGPGSFTGLRIGLATVKAFAVHLQRKVVGVSTLAAIACASQVKGEVLALLPAGRGELFTQQFVVGDHQITELDRAQHLSPRALIEQYGAVERLTLAGEGAGILEGSVGAPHSGGLKEPGASQNEPLAPAIAVLGYRAYREGKSMAPEDLRAAYLRASDAEINERWQQRKAQQPAQS
jgi:tRNA threonylcarbamoyladenosine biosynthesis protein TsaB